MGIMTAEVAAAEIRNRLMFWTFTSVVVVVMVLGSRKHNSAVEGRDLLASFMQIYN